MEQTAKKFSFILLTFLNQDMSRLMTKPAKWLCAQGRLRSAWASAQSDPSLLCPQWVAKDSSFLHADSKDWSDWVDAQANLSLRWEHMPFCWFCGEAAHLWFWESETIVGSVNWFFVINHQGQLFFNNMVCVCFQLNGPFVFPMPVVICKRCLCIFQPRQNQC